MFADEVSVSTGPAADAAERPPFPPALMERVGFLLAMAKGGAEAICMAALQPLGLHVRQYGLLLVLATEGPLSQGELAEWVRTDRTTMVALVDDLEERGFVRRERNPDDRRAYLLQLTGEGKGALTRGSGLMRRAESQLMRSLEEGERTRLIELLGKVAADIGRPPSETPPKPASRTSPGSGGRSSRPAAGRAG
jgi:MarR family transcriptional regulator, lower aerobic nicotinate degradation pathway regulator